jgi:hypothetical protein
MHSGSGVTTVTRLVLVIGSIVLAASASQAFLSVELRSDGVLIDTLDEVDMGCAGGSILFCSTTSQVVGDYLIKNLNITLNSDFNFLNSNFAVENQGANTERLTIDIIWTVGVLGPSTLTSGSVSGSVTDGLSGDSGTKDGSATVSTEGGNPFYTALIDGGFYEDLYTAPTSFVTATSQGFGPQDFGMPSPSQPGPGVTSTIGIRYDFNLTNQDQASFTANFRVEPVPEPSTAAILGIGLALLARIGRRRR